MGDAGWGYGQPADRDTGISQVLQAYATQGGQLLGARRWAENPLTLTHVRWVGPSGGVLDGFRQPQDDEGQMPPQERDVWVQLALHFPTAHPSPAGFDAPWLPLNVDPAQAGAWAHAVRQAINTRRYTQQAESAPHYQSYPHSYPQSSPQAYPQATPQSYPAASGLGAGPSPWRVLESASQSAAETQYGRGAEQHISGAPAQMATSGDPRPASAAAPRVPAMPPDVRGAAAVNSVPPAPFHSPAWRDARQPSPWDSVQGELPEIALLPSVEIELPPLMPAGGPAGRREFARDTALVFVRALRPLPQVRELRGWMRGERLVLAARYVAAIGHRAATYAEMETAARHVADALARHTLPYAWLGFAEPGEWVQGAALPE